MQSISLWNKQKQLIQVASFTFEAHRLSNNETLRQWLNKAHSGGIEHIHTERAATDCRVGI